METADKDLKTALFDLLRTLDAKPGVPISNYDIGVPLVAQGFTQDEIVNLLFSLQHQKVIDLPPGNRMELLMELK